ncbi:MAG: phytanoyl-CoA dioxygenase family protein [Ilumatobacteraceae bacterium]
MVTNTGLPAAVDRHGIDGPDFRAAVDAFHRDGYLPLTGVLPEARVAALNDAVDAVLAEEPPAIAYNIFRAVERHALFADLMEESLPLAHIVNHLGYNLQLHSSVLSVRRPVGDAGGDNFTGGSRSNSGRHVSLNWHRDGPAPQFPRVDCYSAKVCFVLSDMSEAGRGNTRLVPGSHVRAGFRPDLGDPASDVDGAIEVTASPGDAFLFSQNLWHAAAPNRSAVERRLIFIGYSAFWARPVDRDGPLTSLLAGAGEIRRQLVGDIGDSPVSRYVPTDEMMPLLRFWRGAEPVASYA